MIFYLEAFKVSLQFKNILKYLCVCVCVCIKRCVRKGEVSIVEEM